MAERLRCFNLGGNQLSASSAQLVVLKSYWKILPAGELMKLTLWLLRSFVAGGIIISTTAADWVEWQNSAGGNGHAYLPVITTAPISWSQANEAAQKAGGYLATLTSSQENEFVFALIDSPEYWYLGQFGPYIGGYQPPGSPEPAGGWTWVTGEPWEYTNWAEGQPDNGGGEEGLHFWNTSHWNDLPTNHLGTISYVIERGDYPCTPHKAHATAELVNGFVVGATITDAGCGYTNAPQILIEGGGGSGATARAEINDGQITRIIITNAGFDYENPPRIIIASPPFAPTLSISVSRVKVVQNIVLGRKYVLESSLNGTAWNEALPPFTATSESITNEFDSELTGRLFRVREIP